MTSTSSILPKDALIVKADADLKSLDRVAHRLALLTEDKLPEILDKLLPRLLQRIGDNHQALVEVSSSSSLVSLDSSSASSQLQEKYQSIHTKLVDMLSHCMKRARAYDQCTLPCTAIVDLLLDAQTKKPKESVNVFCVNLSLAFLAIGVGRQQCCDMATTLVLLQKLLCLFGYTAQETYCLEINNTRRLQSNQVGHLVLTCLEQILLGTSQQQVVLQPSKKPTTTNVSEHDSSWQQVKEVIQSTDSVVAASLYDLLLDSLLLPASAATAAVTTTSATITIPPDGMSASGAHRLVSRAYTSSSTTAMEEGVSASKRLERNKLLILDLIAPSRKWAIFLAHTPESIAQNSNSNDDNTSEAMPSHETAETTTKSANATAAAVNLSRTIALLVVASGDPSIDVSERAKNYLKMYMDSFRGNSSADALGDALLLAKQFLVLCVGEQQAEALIRNNSAVGSAEVAGDGSALAVNTSLGTRVQPRPTDSPQGILNAKRRPVSQSSMTVLAQFVATKVLQDQPHLFDYAPVVSVQNLAELVVLLADRTLASMTSVSGLTKLKGRPYVAAAELLNALSIRLATYHDLLPDEERQSMVLCIAKALKVSCLVLEGVASRPAVSSGQRTITVDEGNVSVRDACYGIICTLSRSQFVLHPEGFIFHKGEAILNADSARLSVSIQTAKLLFACAANEEEKLRHRAVAALDALLAAYCRLYTKAASTSIVGEAKVPELSNPWASEGSASTVASSSIAVNHEVLSRSLLPLLWAAAQPYQPKASRVAAARWASQILKELALNNGCHLLCFLSGDLDSTAASIAREGLGLSQLISETIPIPSDELKLPVFSEFVSAIFSDGSTNDNRVTRLQHYREFSDQGKVVALRLGILALLNDFYEGDETAILKYVEAICMTLELFKDCTRDSSSIRSSLDLLDEASLCIFAIVSTSQLSRVRILDHQCSLQLDDFEKFAVVAPSSRARRHLSGVCGKLYDDFESWNHSSQPESSFDKWAEIYKFDDTLQCCLDKLAMIQQVSNFSFGEVHGSAFLGAHIVRAIRLRVLVAESDAATSLWGKMAKLLVSLGSGVISEDESMGNACADALTIALSYDGIDAPVLDLKLYDSSSDILSSLAKALAKFGEGNAAASLRVLKLAKAAGVCLGSSSTGAGVVLGRLECVEALFGLLGSNASRHNEEVSLAAGDALAEYADSYSPTGATWTSAKESWSDGYDEETARQLPPYQHVIYVLLRKILTASSPPVRTSCGPALLAIVARTARGLHANELYASRVLPGEILNRLGTIQMAFIQLLSDPKIKHISRESCCLGLAACRGIASASHSEGATGELNQRLFSAFGQATSYAGSAMIETREQAAARRETEGRTEATGPPGGQGLMEQFGFEAEVGGVANMGEGALGAYREMASASLALGRDDILYALLFLSISHPVWFSEEFRDQYSVVSLLGKHSQIGDVSNMKEMQMTLRPHMGKLIPRILRARHDPNKQTSEQMTSLWNGLTGGGAESRDLITQHLTTTIDALLDETANKLWRARCGALGALSEVIVGREWAELGGGGPILTDDDLDGGSTVSAGIRLLRLWRMATRALDDVRGAVRDAGENLARGVRALTIRLCDPSHTVAHGKRMRGDEESQRRSECSAAAAATALRWLCRFGLNQPCPEATGICVSTLIEIVGLPSVSTILQPILPELLKSLLLAMSGLEPAALNYLQLRATDQEGLERLRLQIAQSGPLAGAVTKCLEIVPRLDEEHQRAIIPQLDAALRLSAGFATRAAVADAVSSLCLTCPKAFYFTCSPSMNPTVRLLRAFYYASERERGDASKDKMIHALGNLSSLCPGGSVRQLASNICDRYRNCTGNNDDPVSRRACAAALRAIATRASDQFSEGGKTDIWGEKILPTAFLGCKDSDKRTASYWKEVWDEGGSAFSLSDDSSVTFGTRLEEKILHRLVRECVLALRDVAWSRRVAGSTALIELSDLGILEPLSHVPQGTTNEVDTYKMGRAHHRAEAVSWSLRECVLLLSKPRLWNGKAEVIEAVVRLTSKWSQVEASTNKDPKQLYGWNESKVECPWIPVILSTDRSDDLFLGDSWFASHDETIDVAVDEADTPPEVLAVEEAEEQLNMEDCDKVLSEEEEAGNNKQEVDEYPFRHYPVVYGGLCRLLVQHGLSTTQSYSDYSLPYRAAALKGLRDILASLPKEADKIRESVYVHSSAALIAVLENRGEKPLIVASIFSALGELFWSGFGFEQTGASAQSLSHVINLIKASNKDTPVWTVREASTLCMAKLVTACDGERLRQPSTVSLVVTWSNECLKDSKFWKVRSSGVKLLHSLVSRAGTRVDPNVLIMESILPHKEEIMKILRSSLKDSESSVTSLSSEVLGALSWWP